MPKQHSHFAFELRVLYFLLWLFLLLPLSTLAQAGKPPRNLKPSCKADGEDRFICGDFPEPPPPSCKGFKSVVNTSQPDPIILAENHHKRSTTARCIDDLTKDLGVHTIYIEKVEAGKETSCQQQGFQEKPGRKCVGWDDMEAAEEFERRLLAEQQFKTYIGQIKQLSERPGTSETKIDAYLQHLLKEYGSNPEISPALTWLLAKRKAGHSYKIIFSKDYPERNDLSKNLEHPLHPDAVRKLNRDRNVKLLETLADNPPNQFRLVVGGHAHFIKSIADTGDAERLRQELDRRANRYALLAMMP